MAHYLLQIAYTSGAWAAMIGNPHAHIEGLRPLLEELGGKIEGSWLAFGDYHAVWICQLPDHASAAAFTMAASAEGVVKAIHMTPLMTVEDGLEALRKVAAAHDHTSSLPVPRAPQPDYKELLSSRLQKFKQRMGKMVTGRR